MNKNKVAGASSYGPLFSYSFRHILFVFSLLEVSSGAGAGEGEGGLPGKGERPVRLATWWWFDVEDGADVMHEEVQVVFSVIRASLDYRSKEASKGDGERRREESE